MANFEKLNDKLIKGVDYVKENCIEGNETIVNQIELLLDKTKDSTIPQIKAIREKTQTFDLNIEMNNNEEEDDNELPQQQEIIMDLMTNKEVLEHRRKELEGIHKTAAILKDTTDQMAQNVHKQGEQLEIVDNQVQEAKDNALKAKKEINDANEMAKGNSKKMCCFIIIIMITVAVIIAIVLSLYFSFS